MERRRLWGIVERDPTLLHIEGVREKLGVDIPNFAPPLTTGTDLDRPGPPPPPAPERTQQLRTLGRPPERAAETDGIESSIVSPSPLLGTANAVVLAALAIGGRRLRTAPYRSMFNDVDPTIMHTKIKVSGEDHAMELLASAWTTAEPSLAYINIDPKWILPKLEKYAVQVMCAEIEHSPGLLARFLANEGVVV